MPKPDHRAIPRCDLSVTGKRVRRALPAIPPPPAFRTALKQAVSVAGGAPVTGPAEASDLDINSSLPHQEYVIEDPSSEPLTR